MCSMVYYLSSLFYLLVANLKVVLSHLAQKQLAAELLAQLSTHSCLVVESLN